MITGRKPSEPAAAKQRHGEQGEPMAKRKSRSTSPTGRMRLWRPLPGAYGRTLWPSLRARKVSGNLPRGSVSRPCRLNGTMVRQTRQPEERRRDTGPDAGSVPIFSFALFFLACRAVSWASVQVRLVRDKEVIRIHRLQETIGSGRMDMVGKTRKNPNRLSARISAWSIGDSNS